MPLAPPVTTTTFPAIWPPIIQRGGPGDKRMHPTLTRL